jgi:hypothetical protein
MGDRIKVGRKAEIMRILAAENGVDEPTPNMIVAAARSGRFPDLHEYFDWDKDRALERSLLDQARAFITSITINWRHRNNDFETVAYVRDPNKGAREQGYRPVAELRTEDDNAIAAIERECRSAEGALLRAQNLALTLGKFDVFTDLITRVQDVANQLRPKKGERKPRAA